MLKRKNMPLINPIMAGIKNTPLITIAIVGNVFFDSFSNLATNPNTKLINEIAVIINITVPGDTIGTVWIFSGPVKEIGKRISRTVIMIKDIIIINAKIKEVIPILECFKFFKKFTPFITK